jgi:hypothetical protein
MRDLERAIALEIITKRMSADVLASATENTGKTNE